MNWTLPLPDNLPFRLYVVGHRLVILVEIVKLGDKSAKGKAREIIATESISLRGLTPWALGKGICSMDRMASGGFGHGQSAEKREGAYLDICLLCFVRFFQFFSIISKTLGMLRKEQNVHLEKGGKKRGSRSCGTGWYMLRNARE